MLYSTYNCFYNYCVDIEGARNESLLIQKIKIKPALSHTALNLIQRYTVQQTLCENVKFFNHSQIIERNKLNM